MVVWMLAAGAGLLLGAAAPGGQARAEEPNRAGLVVRFEGGRVETRCVEFDEPEITGAELLDRSGLPAVVDPSSGLGVTVCSIDGQGCAYPSRPCFCRCSGSGPCAYWNYYSREPGAADWTYQALGALLHKVRPGALDAWVWGDGHTPPSADLSFAAVCPAAATGAAVTVPPPTSAAAAPVAAATATTIAAAPPSAANVPAPPAPTTVAAAPTQRPAPGTGGGGASALLFVAMALGLLVVGVVMWLRGRR